MFCGIIYDLSLLGKSPFQRKLIFRCKNSQLSSKAELNYCLLWQLLYFERLSVFQTDIIHLNISDRQCPKRCTIKTLMGGG